MGYIFVSGWKREPGEGGVCQYSFDNETGKIELIRKFEPDLSLNVSFLNKEESVLYVLNEAADQPGFRVGGGGSVYAIPLCGETGEPGDAKRFPSFCSMPCNIAIDPENKYFVVAGHGSKSYVTHLSLNDKGEYYQEVLTDDTPLILFEKTEDGGLGKVLDVKFHKGSGPKRNQMTAHPHSTEFSPSGKLLAVCDKGADKVFMYGIDYENEKLKVLTETDVNKGEAPRYCLFHPELPYFYHNNEGSSKVNAYRYDEDGNISLIGVYESLETCAGVKSEGQGLRLHPNGKYLYNAINGEHAVSVFEINEQSGELTLVQCMKPEYEWPRGIALSADAAFLAVTFVHGKKVAIYRLGEDGKILEEVSSCSQDNAAYVTFWQN